MKKFNYVIKDEIGLHARLAGFLVKEAKKFECEIALECGERRASAKKLMAIMGMAVKNGEEVIVTLEGADEDAAAEAMQTFFESKI